MQITRVRWLIAGFWLLAFWLLAGMVVAPALQHHLEVQASTLINEKTTGYEAVQVKFDGQRAILTGQVRHDEQRVQILNAAQHDVRGSGPFSTKLNPVQQVVDALEIVPYPPGWLLLAAHGTRGQLLGAAATEFESRDLYSLIQDRWAAKGGRIESKLIARPELHDEAPDLKQTLAQIPLPDAREGADSAQIQIASLGGPWQRLMPDAKDERLMEQSLAIGIPRQEWEKSILPLIQNARRYQSEQRNRAEETARQIKLPPPHLFLAAREKRLLVRGQTATVGIKREFLNALIIKFPEWRVIDDVRVNPDCRAVSDFGPITTALLPEPLNEDSKNQGKSLVLGLSGHAWKPVEWIAESDTPPWTEDLPKDLPSRLLQDDHRMVIGWLQGETKGIPNLPIRAQPSFLTLILLPQKVIFAGQLAEESLHTQLIEAARQKYSGQAIVISDSLLVRGACAPSSDIQQTLRSLPPLPEADSPGSIAFATPGQIWKNTPADSGIDQAGAVAKSGILPADFPAAMAEDTFGDGFDHLRQHWKKLAIHANKESAP
jgi:hypothetical protein